MACRARERGGFTLLEVMAAVLVLGLVFTMLAEVAIVGLRSEGRDRRRAEASLLADRELAVLESALAAGAPLEEGVATKEVEPFRITVEVAPEDVMALLPAPARDVLLEGEELATMLVDEQGNSRVLRLSVVVEWDDGVEPERVFRTTHALDTSELAALFPAPTEDDRPGEPALDEPPDDGPVTDEQVFQLEQLLRERGELE